MISHIFLLCLTETYGGRIQSTSSQNVQGSEMSQGFSLPCWLCCAAPVC